MFYESKFKTYDPETQKRIWETNKRTPKEMVFIVHFQGLLEDFLGDKLTERREEEYFSVNADIVMDYMYSIINESEATQALITEFIHYQNISRGRSNDERYKANKERQESTMKTLNEMNDAFDSMYDLCMSLLK